MTLTRLSAVGGVVLALAVAGGGPTVLGAAADARPREAERGRGKQVAGRLKTIDVERGTLTLVPGGDRAPPLETFNLQGADIPVRSDLGRALKLGDLKEGMGLLLRLSPADDVVEIIAESPTMRGVVQNADEARRTVTFQRTEDLREPTFGVAPQADITLDGRKVGLGDLRPNTPVVAKLSFDRRLVLALQGGRAREGGREAARINAQGTLKAVDVDKNTITVAVAAGREGQAEERSFQVADDARILVPAVRGARLADLKPGMQVALALAEDCRTVAGIVARSPEERGDRPEVSGLVKAVDPQRKTLTLVVGRGDDAEQTFRLAESVKFVNFGRGPAGIEDLKPGMRVALKLTENRQQVALVYAAPAGREAPANALQGVIKARDLGKRTITLTVNQERQEKEVTLALARDVRITARLTPEGNVENPEPGMRATLMLSRDRTTVLEIILAPQDGGRRPQQEGVAPPRPR